MIPYLFTFFIFLVGYFVLEIVTVGRRNLARTLPLILLLPLTIFAMTYAGKIGSDVVNYGYLFEMVKEVRLEPGFSFLMSCAKSLGFDYIGFTKIMVLIQMLLLASIIIRLRDPLLFLLFYLSSFFLNFQFNAIRNSLALLIIAFFIVRVRRPGLMTLLFSSVIHYSSFITIALSRLATTSRQVAAISVVVIVGIFFEASWLYRDYLFGNQFGYIDYFMREYESQTIYPALLLKLFIVWLLYRNGGNRFYMYAYATFVVLVHILAPIFNRVCDLILLLFMLDFCYRHRLQRHRTLVIILTLILVISSLLIPWRDCQRNGVDHWCLDNAGL